MGHIGNETENSDFVSGQRREKQINFAKEEKRRQPFHYNTDNNNSNNKQHFKAIWYTYYVAFYYIPIQMHCRLCPQFRKMCPLLSTSAQIPTNEHARARHT